MAPMNMNNSSGVKKLLSSDSKKPRPMVLPATVVSKLNSTIMEHQRETFMFGFCWFFVFFFCLLAAYVQNVGNGGCQLLGASALIH